MTKYIVFSKLNKLNLREYNMLLERPMDASNVEVNTFTSIGKLGVSRRSSERLYVNGTQFTADPAQLDQNLRRLIEIGKRHEQKIGRTVFRGLVSGDVIDHVLRGDIRRNLEVAFPVGEFTGDDSWLVYMANNKKGREEITSRSVMIEKTSEAREMMSPLEKVKSTLANGLEFTDKIEEEQVDQLLSLWGETFGWKREQIEKLRERLENNRCKHPSQRDVWFSAATKDGKIVSVAMAERLSVPGANGSKLDLVESTEWRSEAKHSGNGLATATLDMLNAQVLSDLRDSSSRLPLIFAECNFQSGAHGVGRSAGLRVPERTKEGYPAPQILIQNVLIRDDHPVGDSKQRDLTFLYLPRDVIERYYSPTQVEQMKSLIKS